MDRGTELYSLHSWHVRGTSRKLQPVCLPQWFKVLVDTRAGITGAALVAAGYSVDEAASMTFLAGLKPDQQRMLKGSVQ